MSIYEDLGIKPIINASATLTKLGGSRMPREVLEAMHAAAGSFIDLPLLQTRVGDRIAELTQNDAAFVSSGAAAGIVLAVATFMAAPNEPDPMAYPMLKGITRNEAIVFTSQRNGYDFAIGQTGASIVECDDTLDSFEAAITGRTACLVWFAGALAAKSPPIEDVIAIARKHHVPVLVDAAAQIPPVSNLWHYTKVLGCDGVVFSGGKGIRGPQAAGLVLGSRGLIAGCRRLSSPTQGIGRPMKVGKEELAGMLAAVQYTLNQDEDVLLQAYESIVQNWIDALAGIAGVTTERGFPSEAGQPHARTLVRLDAGFRKTRDQVVDELKNGDVWIEVAAPADEPNTIALNPQTLTIDEADVVAARLRQVLAS
ncbi:MAG TPA: aminotransferase class V-fold PLP-dependent enzyme [Devosia sp.]|uniref:aminotransferase class V-fold PLP-dependent enzyme n=1 Tax=Devosia sp. TaxID=1871048 RepID=UPI002DDCB201|nr:aminotransferase class V-fold PLP-dependent enzyme [Devosia sp.]HEV2515636.1 aminotransferase class V-fold PLP-dependent enzyme [Devosia sp.]